MKTIEQILSELWFILEEDESYSIWLRLLSDNPIEIFYDIETESLYMRTISNWEYSHQSIDTYLNLKTEEDITNFINLLKK